MSDLNEEPKAGAAPSDKKPEQEKVVGSKLRTQKKGGNRKDVEEMTEEDRKKKEEIDQLVEQIMQSAEPAEAALKTLSHELQTATSSLTSVPKPLKLLAPHYGALVEVYETLKASTFKAELADLLSVLSAVFSKDSTRKMLKYRLEGTNENLTKWGDDYMRNLSSEIILEYSENSQTDKLLAGLEGLVDEIVTYYMAHNAEVDALDLLCEVDRVEKILQLSDSASSSRVVLYILSMSNYAVSHEEQLKMLRVAFSILLKEKDYTAALRVAMKCNDSTMVASAINSCEDRSVLKQLALMCSRQHVDYEFEDDELVKISSGELLSNFFLMLGKELNVMKPKLPDQIYKIAHEDARYESMEGFNPVRKNIATLIVNAFVNAGFCTDKTLTEDFASICDCGGDAQLIAAASLGVLLLWNVDEGLNKIDKYQYSSEVFYKTGAYMAFGLLCSNVLSECDPAQALLCDKIESGFSIERRGAIMGLGFAYAGTKRVDILELLVPIILSSDVIVDISALAAMNIGLVFVGSGNMDAAEAIMTALTERNSLKAISEVHVAYMYAVGLALLFLGSRDSCEPIIQSLRDLNSPFSQYAIATIEGMSAAGSGDVLKVQSTLQTCLQRPANAQNERAGESPFLDKANAVSVLNIPLIALGEEVGSEMSLRMLDHMLQYSDVTQRRAVPLALALQSVSHPKPSVVDALSKLTHDPDTDTVHYAVVSLGIVGAGTNNSRISETLRQLAHFYAKDSSIIFMIRISQGLLHMGKGLLSISPSYSDRFLIHPVALGSLLIVLHTFLNVKITDFFNRADDLFYLVPAMHPRMLITVDEELNPLPVSVRVGQAVDVVGQAGHPKTITGFQTHTTPVLLSYSDRAELVNDDYLPLTPVLEGVVILRKNPDYIPSRIN